MMRTAAFALLALTGCAHGKSGEIAEYSYATGCFQAFQRVCPRLATDESRGVCYDEALESCEKSGRQHGDWIRNGNSAEPLRKR